MGRRLQRPRGAGHPARLGGRSRGRPAAAAVRPRRRPDLDPAPRRRRARRARRHPGASVRRCHDGARAGGGAVGQPRARAALVAIHDLGTLGGAVSQGKAVNRRGQVVGTSRDALGRTRAFLWEESLGIVDLKPLTGVNTSANDINDNGEIAGGGDTGFGDFHAYLLSAGTSFDLGTLGGNESEALAVNGRGQVAGPSRAAGGGAAPKHAFGNAGPGTSRDPGTRA